MDRMLDLPPGERQDGAVALSENDDLVQRGRAIFDRLREDGDELPLPEEAGTGETPEGAAEPPMPEEASEAAPGVDDEALPEDVAGEALAGEPVATGGPGQADRQAGESADSQALGEVRANADGAAVDGADTTAGVQSSDREGQQAGASADQAVDGAVTPTGMAGGEPAGGSDSAPGEPGSPAGEAAASGRPAGGPTGDAAASGGPAGGPTGEAAGSPQAAAGLVTGKAVGSGRDVPALVSAAVADAAAELDEAPESPASTPDSPTPASPMVRPLPRIMAIANQKGGVGKTTTAVNLGAALAELGYRVLVVDLDPQGNATTGLGINPRTLESSIYDVIMHDTPLEDCIEPTSLRNLFVVPATIDLAGAEIELVPAFSRELKLRRALHEVEGDFDYTLIDCPPSLGLITVNGLAAATEVVVPIQCEYYALEGLGQLLRNVSLVQGNLNPTLEVSAIILTMFDARTKLADQVAGEVRAHFGEKVCRNIVPRTVRLSEAPSFGQPIIVFDPSSRGAIAYRELAKEVSGGSPQRVG
jgi:chromosome partitioning protein